MSLADKLEALTPVHKPKFEQYIDSLAAEDRDALIAAARNKGWTTTALLRVLKDEGVAVGKESLTAWRRHVSQ